MMCSFFSKSEEEDVSLHKSTGSSAIVVMAHSQVRPRKGGKRARDDLGSANIIIKRLSISSSLPPSQSDDLYDEKNEKMSASGAYSLSVNNDVYEDDDLSTLSYDADNEKDRGMDPFRGNYGRSMRLREEFDPSATPSNVTPASPSFVFHCSRDRGGGGVGQAHTDSNKNMQGSDNVNGNVKGKLKDGNDNSSDSDCSYMLPRARGLVTSKLVRGRNPATHIDLLIDDVIKKSARRSNAQSSASSSNMSLIPLSEQSNFHLPASIGPHPTTDISRGLSRRKKRCKKVKNDTLVLRNRLGSTMDEDDDGNCSTDEDIEDDDDDDDDDKEDDINLEQEQIFGLDHSLYEYHKTLNSFSNGKNHIINERFTGNVSHADCFVDDSPPSPKLQPHKRESKEIVLSPSILGTKCDTSFDEMSSIMTVEE